MKKSGLLRAGTVLSLAGALVAGASVTASAGEAGAQASCPSTSLCLIKNNVTVLEFDEVGPWTYFDEPLAAPIEVANMRTETVWILHASGSAQCISPRTMVDVPWGALEAVRVDDSEDCELL
ncbi:hypothetical protein [Streptomyces sp. RFCAC02]|uniref:hypothetical protein n=1 Tax=Streptomyces sp. RFCAC02 TaxID=2499143 RepID=UPI0010200712|nr:hypothetical protein [Streptomyces sp. RFCAC02]